MLSRISSLKCFAVNVSKFITTRKTTPVSYLLLHTATADCMNGRRAPPPRRPKVAVILYGCGIDDGSEPCEVVSLDIHLDGHNILADYYAPNISANVFDHFRRKDDLTHQRNCMREANRLLINNNVRDLMLLQHHNYAGLIIPGGRGHYKMPQYLMNFLGTTIINFRNASKPIGTISVGACPVALMLQGVLFTVGIKDHSYYNYEIQQMLSRGMNHRNEPPGGLVWCPKHNVFSTPGYSYCTVAPVLPEAPDFKMPPPMSDAFDGISRLVIAMSPQLRS